MKKFLFLIFSLFAINIMANELDKFTINALSVHEVSKDATTARQRAMTLGQRKAFNSVLERLNIDSTNSLMISNDEISQMLLSMQIKNEKITTNSYSASLDIQFNPEYVKHILNKHRIGERSKRIESFVVIPIYNGILWEPSNLMMSTFNKTLKGNSIIMPIVGNISTKNLIDERSFSDPNFSDFKRIAENYNVSNIVLVSTEYKNGKPTIDSKITILNTTETRNASLIFDRSDSGLNQDLHDSSLKIIEYLENLYADNDKPEVVTVSANSNKINIFAYISDMRSFMNVENKLKTDRNIVDMKLVMVSKNRVVYLVEYSSYGIEYLITSLKDAGYVVEQKSDGLYLM